MEYIYNGNQILLGKEDGAYTIFFLSSSHTILKEVTVAKEEVIEVIETEYKSLEKELGKLIKSNKKLNKRLDYAKDHSEIEEIKKLLEN